MINVYNYEAFGLNNDDFIGKGVAKSTMTFYPYLWVAKEMRDTCWIGRIHLLIIMKIINKFSK